MKKIILFSFISILVLSVTLPVNASIVMKSMGRITNS